MKQGKIRDQQLAQLICEELEYILCSAEDERLSQLEVTAVEPGAGGAHFIVFVAPERDSSAFASHEEVKLRLTRASKYLRTQLMSSLRLKRAPDLSFMIDPLYYKVSGDL